MKALTLTQPWASLVAGGWKRIETRSWTTSYRGPLAIHAAKGFPTQHRIHTCYAWPFADALAECGFNDHGELPTGAVVAIAELVDVVRFTKAAPLPCGSVYERDFGDFTPGRYGFVLRDVERLAEPVPAKGMLGLWEWDDAAVVVGGGA